MELRLWHCDRGTLWHWDTVTQCDRGRLLIGPFYSGVERGWQATQHKEWLEKENNITSEHNNKTIKYTHIAQNRHKHDPFTVGRRGVGKPHSTKSGWKKKFTPHHSTTTIQNTNKCTHIAKTELQTRPFYSSGAERGWQATQHEEWLEEGKHITTQRIIRHKNTESKT